MGSSLATQKASNIKASGWIELSGTSFAAPVISGIAAQILGRYPDYTPDQVKGAMLRGARAVPQAAPLSCGVGQVNGVQTTLAKKALPNPNLALNRFVKAMPDGSMAFDAVSWTDVSWSDVSWSDVSWEDAAEAEAPLPTDGYELTDPEAADAAADPDLLTPEEAEALLSATASLIP